MKATEKLKKLVGNFLWYRKEGELKFQLMDRAKVFSPKEEEDKGIKPIRP